MQHKTFEATTKKQDGKTYWVASTNHVDREGDTVDPLQMDLSGWVRNGSVLLWGHDYVNMESVIGRAVSVKQTPTELLVVPEWRKPASPTDRMHVALSLIEQGFAKAMSIGFRALEAPTKNSYGGVDYGKIEILEISVTQVPANSFASRNYRGRHAAGPGRTDRTVRAYAPAAITRQRNQGGRTR